MSNPFEELPNTNSEKKLSISTIKMIIVFLVITISIVLLLFSHISPRTINKDSYMIDNQMKNSKEILSPTHPYENGTYKIGVDMPGGEYVLFTDSSGYFSVSSDSSGNSILFNDNFKNNSIVTIKNGEYLKLSRCYAEPISDVKLLSTDGEGMFLVGEHLSAGEYKLQATESGYYCIYSNSRHDDIIDNDNFENETYVTVRNGQYLLLSRAWIVS